jgi:hypothetical protein
MHAPDVTNRDATTVEDVLLTAPDDRVCQPLDAQPGADDPDVESPIDHPATGEEPGERTLVDATSPKADAVSPAAHASYQRLAAEVLRRAIVDATKAKDPQLRADALEWLTSSESAADRAWWCAVGGVNAGTFERLVRERLGGAVVA